MRSPLVALLTVALGLALAVAATTWNAGCSSCGACPETAVLVTASTNVNLDIDDMAWTGPACPNYPPMCRGDDVTTNCTHVYITGAAPGACDLAILFHSGLAQVVHTEFAAPPQACCPGVAVVGETTFLIPTDRDAGVVGADGPTDAVTTLDLDAGDGGVAPDAGADAGADSD
jgi:hypothetical protein